MQHENSIRTKISSQLTVDNEGKLFFPGDFLQVGTPEAVNMGFSRLAKDRKIMRLAKGIYLYPKKHEKLGILLPSLEDIAHQIADREHVRIRPTGSYALNKLGLSTQVPTKVVYLTNGGPKKIKVGKGTITFKSTTPKKMAAESELTFMAVQALITLGEKNIDNKVIEQLTKVLKQENPDLIRKGAQSGPIWVARLLYIIANTIQHHDSIPEPTT
jgi:Family of unknown function (DUF6088)